LSARLKIAGLSGLNLRTTAIISGTYTAVSGSNAVAGGAGVAQRRTFAAFKGEHMKTYVMLFNFTDQGIRNVKEVTISVEPLRDLADSLSVTVRNIFWTLGQYDMVAIIEAPNEIAATALGLSLGKAGNVRTQTLRAFSQAEMGPILGKVT
jgi:uncharacterized protein with GYD domain